MFIIVYLKEALRKRRRRVGSSIITISRNIIQNYLDSVHNIYLLVNLEKDESPIIIILI